MSKYIHHLKMRHFYRRQVEFEVPKLKKLKLASYKDFALFDLEIHSSKQYLKCQLEILLLGRHIESLNPDLIIC